MRHHAPDLSELVRTRRFRPNSSTRPRRANVRISPVAPAPDYPVRTRHHPLSSPRPYFRYRPGCAPVARCKKGTHRFIASSSASDFTVAQELIEICCSTGIYSSHTVHVDLTVELYPPRLRNPHQPIAQPQPGRYASPDTATTNAPAQRTPVRILATARSRRRPRCAELFVQTSAKKAENSQRR